MMGIRLVAWRRLGHKSAAVVLSMDRAASAWPVIATAPAPAPAPASGPATASATATATATASASANVHSTDRKGPVTTLGRAVAPATATAFQRLGSAASVLSMDPLAGTATAVAPATSFLRRPSVQGDGLVGCPRRHMSILYYLRKLPKRFKEFKKLQMNVVDRQGKSAKYPPEIATYLWLISLKARVRFTNGRWYTAEVKGLREQRPVQELMQHSIDAIDASGTLVDYHGMADIIQLPQLEMLSLEGCPHIDDSCLGRLVHLRDSLTHLNISRCPQITQHGMASLVHLRNLERLNMTDLPRVPEARLVACMLEDVLPRLRVSLVTEEVEKHRRQQERWRRQPDQGQDGTG